MRLKMKNEIKVEFKGHNSKQWNTIVLDFNQEFSKFFDKFKEGYRGYDVRAKIKTRDLEGILKRGRSTRQTHWDIR